MYLPKKYVEGLNEIIHIKHTVTFKTKYHPRYVFLEEPRLCLGTGERTDPGPQSPPSSMSSLNGRSPSYSPSPVKKKKKKSSKKHKRHRYCPSSSAHRDASGGVGVGATMDGTERSLGGLSFHL